MRVIPSFSEEFQAIANSCQNSSVGKLLPNALYVHKSAIVALNPLLQDYEQQADELLYQSVEVTLIKFSINKPKISYLSYPDFEVTPHPALKSSVLVDMETQEISYRDYSQTNNPPILHRKETFVLANYPLYQEFAQLTFFEEALGLLDNSHLIGTQQQWQQRLDKQKISFNGHNLICLLEKPENVRVDRHKAAIIRQDLSRPVRLAIEAELLTKDVTFFDYGCGHGEDIQRLQAIGYSCLGWDPYYYPSNPCIKADIVNLGYVINVIENLQERLEALIKAWDLTNQILIVSAQVLINDRQRGLIAYGDGIITGRNTFQKYYEQEELKSYIDQTLDVDAIPVGLGIYFVFRDENRAESFRASRFHSRVTTPRVKISWKSFEDYQELLTPLMGFFTERGRVPVKGELAIEAKLKQEFNTIRRAFHVILKATEPEQWQAITEKRSQELLLYLALSTFSYRPTVRQLSNEMKKDVQVFFGNYKIASSLANKMLLSLRDLEQIANLCRLSPVGKKCKNSLLVHISALESLDPLLRLFEGVASRAIGRLENANVIKFHYHQSKISYLFYPHFDTEPHPILQTIMEINLGTLKVSYWDYENHENPPILHQKDSLVQIDYPFYEKFAKLTRQEQDWGLLNNRSAISHLRGWLECLEANCATITGYRLVRRKDADPYKLKLLRSQVNSRRYYRKKD